MFVCGAYYLYFLYFLMYRRCPIGRVFQVPPVCGAVVFRFFLGQVGFPGVFGCFVVVSAALWGLVAGAFEFYSLVCFFFFCPFFPLWCLLGVFLRMCPHARIVAFRSDFGRYVCDQRLHFQYRFPVYVMFW